MIHISTVMKMLNKHQNGVVKNPSYGLIPGTFYFARSQRRPYPPNMTNAPHKEIARVYTSIRNHVYAKMPGIVIHSTFIYSLSIGVGFSNELTMFSIINCA